MGLQEFLAMFSCVVVPMFAGGAWLWSRLDKRFDYTDQRIADLDKKIDGLTERISRLETRVEERTLKVIYTAKPLEDKIVNN